MGGTSAAGCQPRRRFACPGVVEPMETGDGWLLRVRLPGGAVTATQLDAIAAASQRWGRGVVDITARGNLQLRGLPADAVEAAAGTLVEAGLADPDPALDALRAVVAAPLTGHDPNEARPVAALVNAQVRALMAAARPGPLAPKFGVVIDASGSIGVSGVPADLLLVARRTATGTVEWSALIGHGATPRWSGVLEPRDDGQLVAMAVDLAARCAARRCRAGELPERDVAAVVGNGRAGAVTRATTPAAASVGVWDHVDPTRANVVGAPRLGRLHPPELRRLAAAARHGLGLRVTPAGCAAVVGVARDDLEIVTRELHGAGCSTDPLDGWNEVSACVGSDGCAAGRADTRTAAVALVATHQARGASLERVHLSGCEKLCGAPRDARLLVADAAGRFVAAEGAP